MTNKLHTLVNKLIRDGDITVGEGACILTGVKSLQRKIIAEEPELAEKFGVLADFKSLLDEEP